MSFDRNGNDGRKQAYRSTLNLAMRFPFVGPPAPAAFGLNFEEASEVENNPRMALDSVPIEIRAEYPNWKDGMILEGPVVSIASHPQRGFLGVTVQTADGVIGVPDDGGPLMRKLKEGSQVSIQWVQYRGHTRSNVCTGRNPDENKQWTIIAHNA